MKTFFITFITIIFSSTLMAEETNWFETQKDSHIFIKKNTILTDKNNPNLKTIIISINIPAVQDRRALPNKTLLANAYPISYVTEYTVNCLNKTAKIGKQTLHENFYGEGKILEQADTDPNATFEPLKGTDAEVIWETACKSK